MLFDYRCEAGHVTERFAKSREEALIYCACGRPAQRLAVYEIGVSGFARTPLGERQVKIGAFQEAGAELEYAHGRQTNVDGSLKPTPPLWQAAKREARRLQKLGVKDSAELR